MVHTSQLVFVTVAAAAASTYASPISSWEIEARFAPAAVGSGSLLARLVARKSSSKPKTTTPQKTSPPAKDSNPAPAKDPKTPQKTTPKTNKLKPLPKPKKGDPKPKVPAAPKRPANMPEPPASGDWSELASKFAPSAIQAFETYTNLQLQREQMIQQQKEWEQVNGVAPAPVAARDFDDLEARNDYRIRIVARKATSKTVPKKDPVQAPKKDTKPVPVKDTKTPQKTTPKTDKLKPLPKPKKGDPRPKVPAAPKRPANMPANPPPSGNWADLAAEFGPAAIQAFEAYQLLQLQREQMIQQEQQWAQVNGQPAPPPAPARRDLIDRDFDEFLEARDDDWTEMFARDVDFDVLD